MIPLRTALEALRRDIYARWTARLTSALNTPTKADLLSFMGEVNEAFDAVLAALPVETAPTDVVAEAVSLREYFEHDPLCSLGVRAGDQTMPCDCDGLKPPPAEAAPSPALTRARLRELLVAQQTALDAHRWAMPINVTEADQRLWDATQAAVWALEQAVRGQ